MTSPSVAAPRVLLSWSGGKDAAWALHRLRQGGGVDVAGLMTTLDGRTERVAMHGVPRALVAAQADSVGLPLLPVRLPSWPCPNAEYEAATAGALTHARAAWGVTHAAFGDLFLEDVRAYRERQLAGTGLAPLFPLWGLPTAALAREMVAGGLRARLTSVDPRALPPEWAGRAFDAALLDALPPGADPCGERGEFHTFVWDGPMFRRPVPIAAAAPSARGGFVFAELSLEGEGDTTDADPT